MTGSLPTVGRNAAAVRANWSAGTPRSRSRSSSGAVKPRWRIWFRHLIRTLRPERRATNNTRIASTLPSADFAIPDARPDNAARAASIASIVVGLPVPPTQLTVRTIDLDHLEPTAAQITGQPRAVRAGAFHPHPTDRAERLSHERNSR